MLRRAGPQTHLRLITCTGGPPMKTLLVALAFALVALPATVNAQDWVMDWNSHGSSVGILTGPFAEGWSISGSSPTTLFAGGRDTQFGLPPNFSAPTYDLAFTWQGRTYGGPVSVQSHFQSPVWAAPVPCAGVFTTSCTISGSDGGGAFGSFAFTDSNHFSLDVVVGTVTATPNWSASARGPRRPRARSSRGRSSRLQRDCSALARSDANGRRHAHRRSACSENPDEPRTNERGAAQRPFRLFRI